MVQVMVFGNRDRDPYGQADRGAHKQDVCATKEPVFPEDLSQEPYYYRLLDGDQQAWRELLSLLPPGTKVIPPTINQNKLLRMLAGLRRFLRPGRGDRRLGL